MFNMTGCCVSVPLSKRREITDSYFSWLFSLVLDRTLIEDVSHAFHVLAPVLMKMQVFYNMTSCKLAYIYTLFGEARCFPLQGQRNERLWHFRPQGGGKELDVLRILNSTTLFMCGKAEDNYYIYIYIYIYIYMTRTIRRMCRFTFWGIVKEKLSLHMTYISNPL
jgi:hypothetical protein